MDIERNGFEIARERHARKRAEAHAGRAEAFNFNPRVHNSRFENLPAVTQRKNVWAFVEGIHAQAVVGDPALAPKRHAPCFTLVRRCQ